MDRLTFRKALNDLLISELGHFDSGMPALWVDSGDVPSKYNGLLCLIERQPNMINHKSILGYQAEQHFDWVVRLITRDRSPTGLANFDRACEKMRLRFPNHRERILPPDDGGLSQATFLCNFYTLVNTYAI
jgi:hypothetical protein